MKQIVFLLAQRVLTMMNKVIRDLPILLRVVD